MTAEMVLLRGQQKLRQWACDDRVRMGAKVTAYAGMGFLLSAAALFHGAQPFAMALVCTLSGWRALAMGLGSLVGYNLFWGAHGLQGMVWSVLGMATALLLGKRRIVTAVPMLLPALAGLWVSATGLGFQIFVGDDTPVPLYLLRVALAPGAVWLFMQVLQRKEPVADWVAQGILVLALAQVAPAPWLCLGYLAAGALAMKDAFPAAALGGLALDLARVTPVPMTAVLCVAYMTRLIPHIPQWARRLAPAGVYIAVMVLCAEADLRPVLPLLLGGFGSVLLPPRAELSHRRGETGLAQVRLELMAGVLTQTQQLLMEAPDIPIDEEALLARTRERACGGCSNCRNCGKLGPIPKELLHKPVLEDTPLPFPCRKPGRMRLELRRTQEQYRLLRADRDRRREYREAVVQQYGFLSGYLQQLSDKLPRRGEKLVQSYTVETAVRTAGKEAENGDKCQCFHGTGCKYYVLLCDGMGTGLGAAHEGAAAADMLRKMLTAGFPAEHALRSLNSLLALRGRAGAVTVDLAELRLDKGRAVVYKWGAAPSWLIREGAAEKIGTAGPPPGFDIGSTRETVERLSLRGGEVLILLSDGVAGEGASSRPKITPEEPLGEIAARLLEMGPAEMQDDATVAVIRLHPACL